MGHLYYIGSKDEGRSRAGDTERVIIWREPRMIGVHRTFIIHYRSDGSKGSIEQKFLLSAVGTFFRRLLNTKVVIYVYLALMTVIFSEKGFPPERTVRTRGLKWRAISSLIKNRLLAKWAGKISFFCVRTFEKCLAIMQLHSLGCNILEMH